MHLDIRSFSAKSGMANVHDSVIDLVTLSTISPQVVRPVVLLASPISVASTPSQVGNGGTPRDFCIYRLAPTLHPHHKHSP